MFRKCMWHICVAIAAWFCAIIMTQETSGSRPTCKEPKIANGYIFRGKKDHYYSDPKPDVIDFLCDHKYRIIGDGKIKCTDDGSWSKNPPFCLEIECPQLNEFPNGTISPNPKTSKIGATVNVTCNPGFLLIGKEQFHCTINGTWTHQWMYCKETRCPNIPAIQNGQMWPSIASRPGHVHFACNEGFTLERYGKLYCMADGNWTPNEMPYCRENLPPEDNTTVPVLVSTNLFLVAGILFGIVYFCCARYRGYPNWWPTFCRCVTPIPPQGPGEPGGNVPPVQRAENRGYPNWWPSCCRCLNPNPAAAPGENVEDGQHVEMGLMAGQLA